MRTHNPYYARSEYHTQLAKMSFDKIFDLTARVYFNFYNNTNGAAAAAAAAAADAAADLCKRHSGDSTI